MAIIAAYTDFCENPNALGTNNYHFIPNSLASKFNIGVWLISFSVIAIDPYCDGWLEIIITALKIQEASIRNRLDLIYNWKKHLTHFRVRIP